jgi:putative ABC transport system permease protein
MRTTTLIEEALRALAVNRLRAMLTMLGIVIGIMAVIVMLAVGAGARQRVDTSITSLGTDTLVVTSGSHTLGGVRLGSGALSNLTTDDADAIRKLPAVAKVAAAMNGGGQVISGSQNWATSITGADPSYLDVRGWQLASGRSISDDDERRSAAVALIGQTVVQNVFAGVDPIGQTLRVENTPLTVVGVLAPLGQSFFGRDQDDVVVVPLSTAQHRLFGTARPHAVQMIMVQVADKQWIPLVHTEIEQLLRQRHRLAENATDDFYVRAMDQLVNTFDTVTLAVTILLAAVASVSLIVGGIGVMNTMLVAVTERTREIGVRIALGATPDDIIRQFLLESILMCVTGCVAGVLLGLALSWVAGKLVHMPVIVQSWSIVLAVLVSVGVGVFFGLYPARRAARLDPIEALRYQ